MLFPVHNIAGEVIDQIDLAEDVFGVPARLPVLHQALVRQRANARQGTASTKTRGQVQGSTRKLYMQKHTGRARAGSRRSPTRRGGGVAFGPHPRDYRQAMPKKMRRLALKGALSDKVRQEELVVVEEIKLPQPRTKEMKGILEALQAGPSALLVTPQAEPMVVKSARNLPGVKTLPAPLLNVADLLTYRKLVMTVAAVHRAEEIWGARSAA